MSKPTPIRVSQWLKNTEANRLWCAREVKRLRESGIRADTTSNENGLIAVERT